MIYAIGGVGQLDMIKPFDPTQFMIDAGMLIGGALLAGVFGFAVVYAVVNSIVWVIKSTRK